MTLEDTHYFVCIYGDQQRSQVQIGVADDPVQLEQQTVPTAPHSISNPAETSLNLVYYEHYNLEAVAMERERQLKENPQDMTISLIDSMNPNWLDLSDTLS
ncbi:excinuclease ABC subunit C [Pontibacter sp. 13R65]|uniref:excinuclease ABC subunit C n=1 Tax=Pontibacter sp. 13R65 TaxID=3127458 RepID=UPI00301BF93F